MNTNVALNLHKKFLEVETYYRIFLRLQSLSFKTNFQVQMKHQQMLTDKEIIRYVDRIMKVLKDAEAVLSKASVQQ